MEQSPSCSHQKPVDNKKRKHQKQKSHVYEGFFWGGGREVTGTKLLKHEAEPLEYSQCSTIIKPSSITFLAIIYCYITSTYLLRYAALCSFLTVLLFKHSLYPSLPLLHLTQRASSRASSSSESSFSFWTMTVLSPPSSRTPRRRY